MTAPRDVDAPTGLRPGDHVCWAYDGPAGFSAAVLPYLDEGRRLGEQLLLIGPSRPALLLAVAALPERDEMLASGQLQVLGISDTYDSGRGLVPAEQVQAYRREVAAALDRGRSGLRVAADISELARRGARERSVLHAYEQLADAMIGAVAMTALCLYDASLGSEIVVPIAVLHPQQHLRDQEPLAHLSGRGPRLSLHGELDGTQAEELYRALVDVAGGTPGEVVLDLRELSFLDVAGARALGRATRQLEESGVCLRLVGARRLVRRCLDLFGLSVSEPA